MAFGIGTSGKAEAQAAKESEKVTEKFGEDKENQKPKEEIGSKKEASSLKEIAKEVKEAAGAFGKQATEEKGAGAPANNAKAPEKDLAIG